MLKYLLPSWQKAIDQEICKQCDVFKDEKNTVINKRTAWFYICGFIQNEIKDGEMLKEFEPFAMVYAKESMELRFNSYEIYSNVYRS